MPNDTTTRRPFGDLAKRNLATPEQVFASQGRIPPQATDLEEVVLGALMLEKEAVNEVIKLRFAVSPKGRRVIVSLGMILYFSVRFEMQKYGLKFAPIRLFSGSYQLLEKELISFCNDFIFSD